MSLKYITFILISISLIACQNTDQETNDQKVKNQLPESKSVTKEQDIAIIPDTALVNLKALSNDFVFDMKYASEDNFLKETMYDCANCLLRFNVARALIIANDKLRHQNLRIKLFDCFRPVSVQKKMWAIMPDSRYVADPNKNGSVHNRGAAVDLTIVDFSGNELDMGTGFDHFGEEAHYNYSNLKKEVILNRKLLKTTMENAGFTGINTEWWHFQYGAKTDFPISTKALCEN